MVSTCGSISFLCPYSGQHVCVIMLLVHPKPSNMASVHCLDKQHVLERVV